MNGFTVVSYFTPEFECFEAGLREDCEHFGYPFHSLALSNSFDNLIQAFDFKIAFIKEMVQRFRTVLWLDIECRIVRPVPEHWNSPLISTYVSGKSQGFSSGVLMLDPSQMELIDLWLKYACKYPQYPDDFVLEFLSKLVAFDFSTVPLEFYDRDTHAPIARGLWKNEHTIIQHPTVNRWPAPMQYRRAFNGKERKRRTVSESISRQRKSLFYRNFGGDFNRIDEVMRIGVEREYHDSGWVFDAVYQRYAPKLYWPEHGDDYTSKPRSFQVSWESFQMHPKSQSFRDKAIQRMRLDKIDTEKFGCSRVTSNEKWLSRIRSWLSR